MFYIAGICLFCYIESDDRQILQAILYICSFRSVVQKNSREKTSETFSVKTKNPLRKNRRGRKNRVTTSKFMHTSRQCTLRRKINTPFALTDESRRRLLLFFGARLKSVFIKDTAYCLSPADSSLNAFSRLLVFIKAFYNIFLFR